MAEFLTTRKVSSCLEDLIIEAKEHLILVSPFLQISKILFERLKDATNRNVVIYIIYGKDDLRPNEKNSLAQLENLALFYHENLHAKCYFNESRMIITSMNMYQFSENNNREMGVLIDAKVDKDLYEKADNEVRSIIEHSEAIRLQKTDRTYHHQQNYKQDKNFVPKPPAMGYCLRCSTRIPYDPFRPYCIDCYSSWSYYSNPNFKEKVCHCCGEFNQTSMAYPVCTPCFEKFPFM